MDSIGQSEKEKPICENEKEKLIISLPVKSRNANCSPAYRLLNGPTSPPSGSLEIRLFYVRISPCTIDSLPTQLTLCHLHRETRATLEINGMRVPQLETASIVLRRDRLDRESSEVTYVSTDTVRISGAIEYEVHEGNELVLCGSFERIESSWCNGFDDHQLVNDPKSGWSMNCCFSASVVNGNSSFFQGKHGISSPSIEVYVAGCCSGSPLILSRTIDLSPKKKLTRQGMLDAIPEDEEEAQRSMNEDQGFLCHQMLQVGIECQQDLSLARFRSRHECL